MVLANLFATNANTLADRNVVATLAPNNVSSKLSFSLSPSVVTARDLAFLQVRPGSRVTTRSCPSSCRSINRFKMVACLKSLPRHLNLAHFSRIVAKRPLLAFEHQVISMSPAAVWCTRVVQAWSRQCSCESLSQHN